MKLENLFGKADEKFVKAVTLYGKSGDTNLYTDAAMTVQVGKEDALNLCMKDLAIVSYGGAFYKPVAFKVATAGNVDVVIYDAFATTAAAVTLKSAEA